MKLKLLFLMLFFTQVSYSQDDAAEDFKIDNINNVITLFRQNNPETISDFINFPLRREYPIPDIKNKNELIQRFNEVFDTNLVEKIANSKTEQWAEMGWRGIMLENGIVWIDSYSGKITAVNYQSDYEKELIKGLIEQEKENLHVSLKTFERPAYRIATNHYLIRIDKLADNKYRYASWRIGENEASEPDVTLSNGALKFHGSGGNHVITFSNGNYTYKVYRNSMGGENSPDITLEVENDGQVILTEHGTLIK